MELLRSNQLNRGVVHRFASAMRFILAEGCKNFKKLSRLTLEYLNSSYSISNCENHQLLFFAKISFGHKNMPFQVMLPIHNRIKYFLKWHFCSHKLGFSRNFPSMFILLQGWLNWGCKCRFCQLQKHTLFLQKTLYSSFSI